MKADTGATSTYLKLQDQHCTTNFKQIINGPQILQPDRSILKIQKQCTLPINEKLSDEAQAAYVVPGLKNASLLSIGKLCDDNCLALFTKKNLFVFKNNNLILQGLRNKCDGLWDVMFPTLNEKESNDNNMVKTKEQSMNYIIQADQSQTDLAKYLHACCFSPCVSTFQRAINNGNFLSWPAIETINFKRIIKTTIATEKGHLEQERSNLQTTKNTQEDFFPTQTEKTQHCIFKMIDMNELNNKSHMDLCGRFPYTSSRGAKYILVVYDHDSNLIEGITLKSRNTTEITSKWQILYDKITTNTVTTSFWIIDNEASRYLKTALKEKKQEFQLTPPHIHRINAAERAIRTYKNHLLAGIATCDREYPITEWDRLIEQCNITLNLLRNSRVNPKLSAYAYAYGPFNFNKTPLCPPGTKAIIHLKPGNRGSWHFHGKEGWTIGPSLEHYRCIKCLIPETNKEVDADTLSLIPRYIPIPTPNLDDHLKQTATDLIQLLKHKKHLPGPKLSNNTITGLQILAEIFQTNKFTDQDTIPQQQNQQLRLKSPSLTRKHTLQSTKKKTTHNRKHKPISDEEFNKLLESIPKRNTTTPQKHTTITPPILTNSTTYNKISEGDQTIKENPNTITEGANDRSNTSKTHPNKKLKLLGVPRLQRNYRQQPSQQLTLQHLSVNHIYEGDKKISLDRLMEKDKVWKTSLSNELGRVMQGVKDRIIGTDTMEFIKKEDIPRTKKITYANFVCDYRPLKAEKHRVRMTIGGDRLEYHEDTTSPAASLLETKLLINSVISDAKKGARFMTMDLKDHFLQTVMQEPEFMRIHKRYITDEIKQQYTTEKYLAEDGYIYCKIKRGMYGLKQAARLAYDLIRKRLEPHGYSPNPICPNLWFHNTRKTVFCLCVDDFAVKYYDKKDADHLIKALSDYKITTDWSGRNYC